MRNLKLENIIFLKNCPNLSCNVQPLVSEKGNVWVERTDWNCLPTARGKPRDGEWIFYVRVSWPAGNIKYNYIAFVNYLTRSNRELESVW